MISSPTSFLFSSSTIIPQAMAGVYVICVYACVVGCVIMQPGNVVVHHKICRIIRSLAHPIKVHQCTGTMLMDPLFYQTGVLPFRSDRLFFIQQTNKLKKE
jgi:hypothetical protein